jgi:thymidylate synthase
MVIDVKDWKMPVPGNRKVYPKTAAVEAAWFLRGDRNTGFLKKHGCNIWDKFLDEGSEDQISSAYGYRWREAFGRDQIQCAIDALIANPTDRRIFISAWDPAMDGLGTPKQKNVPCPTSFSLTIVDGRLNFTLFKRSTDVFVGLPYDVMGLFLVQSMLALEIGVKPGFFSVMMAHPHLYEPHWEMAAASLENPPVANCPNVPYVSMTEASTDWDGFVETQRQLAMEVPWPALAVMPEVIQ